MCVCVIVESCGELAQACIRAGWTRLHYAVYHGHSHLVAELLRFSASKGLLKALLTRQDRDEWTASDVVDAAADNKRRGCIARGVRL